MGRTVKTDTTIKTWVVHVEIKNGTLSIWLMGIGGHNPSISSQGSLKDNARLLCDLEDKLRENPTTAQDAEHIIGVVADQFNRALAAFNELSER